MTIPTKMNIGSGKSFLEDYLNVDISDYWSPDIVADLNQPFPANPDKPFNTDRFGPLVLPPGCITEILANDVLEHVRELATCMKSCLDLLADGGRFKISVPYELSTGAWSDPTHVRVFNERSWVYFTDWFWYLGWTTHRFQVEHLHLGCSEYGKTLQQQGKSLEELLRTPRAVESLQVELIKLPLNEEEKQLLNQKRSRGELKNVKLDRTNVDGCQSPSSIPV